MEMFLVHNGKSRKRVRFSPGGMQDPKMEQTPQKMED
jgi:hypothetical protein